jgi:hypothetical protein
LLGEGGERADEAAVARIEAARDAAAGLGFDG